MNHSCHDTHICTGVSSGREGWGCVQVSALAEQLTSVDLGGFTALCCACDRLPARGCASLTHPAAQTPNGEENSPTVAPKALQRELNARCDNGAEHQVSSTSKERASCSCGDFTGSFQATQGRCGKKPQTCSVLTGLKIVL